MDAEHELSLLPVLDEELLEELLLLEQSAGKALVDEIAARFESEELQRLSQLSQMLENGEHDSLRRAAHRLKGASGSLALFRAHKLAARLELSAAAGVPDPRALAALVQAVPEGLAALRQRLDEARGEG